METHDEIIYRLIEVYKRYVDVNSIEYDGRNLLFELGQSNFADNLSTIKSVFTHAENLTANKISLKLKSTTIKNFHVFFNSEDYLKRYNEYSENFAKSQLLILEKDSQVIFKDANDEFSNNKAIIFNNHSYQQILYLLKTTSIFASIKSDNNELIIVSKENSIMHIGYKNYDLRLGELDDLYPDFLLLKKRFEKKDFSGRITENTEFIKLFIETISTAGIGNYESKDRFFEIVKGLKIIISLTERDYNNYINEFSFEKIKSKFKEERNKYFENLEKNIDLISKQVVSFPLTFAATAFASYQVKDKSWILALIFIGYCLYTFIAIRILGITNYNIDCLEKDIIKEEDSVKKSYSKDHNDFEEDFEKIKIKTKKIKDLVFYLRMILFSMLVLFFMYSVFQVFFKKSDRVNENIVIPTEKVKYILLDTVQMNLEKTYSNKLKHINKEAKNIKTKGKVNAQIKPK